VSELAIVALLICAIVALYFVQDKRARAGIGAGAILLALFAGFRRKPKPAPEQPAIIPDTHKRERDEIAKDTHALDDAVIVDDTNPDVTELRARLKARRGMHDTGND
jgi:hypothetical protein